MLDTGIGPMHYGAGNDQEIDTAWQPTTGAWDLEMTTNDFQTFARDTFNVGDIFQFEKGASTVTFDPQSINWIDENNSRQQIAIKQAVSGTVTDDRLDFIGAYGTGIDFQYENQTARLKKTITVDQFSRIDTTLPAGNTIWFEAEFTIATSSNIRIYLDGVEWTKVNGVRVRTSDRVEFRDTDGTSVLWWLDFARAWDSAGNETIGQMEVRRDGGPSNLFITVRIPKAWIDSAVFPIYIDPTIDEQVGASTDDANESNSGGMDLTGTGMTLQEFGNRHVGVRFTTVAVPNSATIDVAYLSIYPPNAGDLSAHCTIHAEDTDVPATYTTATSNITGRTYTTANTTWTNASLTQAAFNNTSSIVSAVQEVVDLVAWDSNDSMAFKISYINNTCDLVIRSYDAVTTHAPKLHIEYTAAGAPAPSVSDSISVSESVNPALVHTVHREPSDLPGWKQGVKIVG